MGAVSKQTYARSTRGLWEFTAPDALKLP